MECDTTGVEPEFALVKFKKLAGGGYFKIINQSVPRALKKLGYTDEEVDDIVTYVQGTSSLIGSSHINNVSLKQKGLTNEEIGQIEATLPSLSLSWRMRLTPILSAKKGWRVSDLGRSNITRRTLIF